MSVNHDPDGRGANNATKDVLGLTTRATPPAEILVAQASIRTHGELFSSPSSQKDRTAFEAAFESRKQPVILLELREYERTTNISP